jgi:hypothetical protein
VKKGEDRETSLGPLPLYVVQWRKNEIDDSKIKIALNGGFAIQSLKGFK